MTKSLGWLRYCQHIITFAIVSYLRSLVVKALRRYCTGVGSIPAGEPLVDEFFSTVPGLIFDMLIYRQISLS